MGRDGTVAFAVTSAAPAGDVVADRGARHHAEGRFYEFRLAVTNAGTEAVTLSHAYQYVVTDDGRRLPVATATLLLPDADAVYLREIAPGETVEDAPLVVDVPDGAVPVALEVRADADSNGSLIHLPDPVAAAR